MVAAGGSIARGISFGRIVHAVVIVVVVIIVMNAGHIFRHHRRGYDDESSERIVDSTGTIQSHVPSRMGNVSIGLITCGGSGGSSGGSVIDVLNIGIGNDGSQIRHRAGIMRIQAPMTMVPRGTETAVAAKGSEESHLALSARWKGFP